LVREGVASEYFSFWRLGESGHSAAEHYECPYYSFNEHPVCVSLFLPNLTLPLSAIVQAP
jgi:hypothetical protein